jgi:hypothetical protein
VQSQVLQNVAVRIDLAFKAFFRRVKAGEAEPGYPRFRGVGRDDSFTFPQVPVGCHLDMEAKRLRVMRLRVMNAGLVKVVLHRPLEGIPKTATIQHSSTDKPISGTSAARVSAPSRVRCQTPGNTSAWMWGFRSSPCPRRVSRCQPALLPPR